MRKICMSTVSLLFLVMLSACDSSDKDNNVFEEVKIEDDNVAYDTGVKFDELEISGSVIEPEAANDMNYDNLILLKSFEEADVELYYYEYYNELDGGYSYSTNSLVFKHNGIYTEYPVDIDDVVIDEFSYGQYDFDNDGEWEIAAALILDHGTGYRDTRLYMFDVLVNGDYQLYCLKMSDYALAVEDAVLKLYKSECGIDYEVTRRSQAGSEMAVGDDYGCEMEADNGNPIKFGDNCVMTEILEEGTIKASVTIFEALPERQFDSGMEDYIENAMLEYFIVYQGEGEFAFRDVTLVHG